MPHEKSDLPFVSPHIAETTMSRICRAFTSANATLSYATREKKSDYPFEA